MFSRRFASLGSLALLLAACGGSEPGTSGSETPAPAATATGTGSAGSKGNPPTAGQGGSSSTGGTTSEGTGGNTEQPKTLVPVEIVTLSGEMPLEMVMNAQVLVGIPDKQGDVATSMWSTLAEYASKPIEIDPAAFKKGEGVIQVSLALPGFKTYTPSLPSDDAVAALVATGMPIVVTTVVAVDLEGDWMCTVTDMVNGVQMGQPMNTKAKFEANGLVDKISYFSNNGLHDGFWILGTKIWGDDGKETNLAGNATLNGKSLKYTNSYNGDGKQLIVTCAR